MDRKEKKREQERKKEGSKRRIPMLTRYENINKIGL